MPRCYLHVHTCLSIIHMRNELESFMTGTKDEMEKLIKSRSDQDENGEGDENEEQESEIGTENEIRDKMRKNKES